MGLRPLIGKHIAVGVATGTAVQRYGRTIIDGLIFPGIGDWRNVCGGYRDGYRVGISESA